MNPESAKILITYRVFGPYHRARWACWREQALATGWDPVAFEIFSKSHTYNWVSDDSAKDGVVRLGFDPGGNNELRWRDCAKLWKILDSLKPNVIVINGWAKRDALLMHLWCRINNVPSVLVSDSQLLDKKRNLVSESIKKRIVKRAGAAFLAGTPQIRYLEFLEFPLSRIALGCDVVHNAHFARNTLNARTPGSGRCVLSVCRLVESKNLLAAIEAFGRFVAERPRTENWEWLIAGYGPLERDIRKAIACHSAQVRLLGAVDYNTLPALYQSADLYWQPSLSEPWGLAVNEAMAAGRPVLVSDRCGCREELVNEKNGWCFDPTTVWSMQQALHVAADAADAWPEMGEHSARVVADWDLPRFSAGLEQAVRIALGAGAEDCAA